MARFLLFFFAVAFFMCSTVVHLSAAPPALTHQGHIITSNGSPMSGSADVTFKIYDSNTGGNLEFSEVISITFDDGYYSVELDTSSVSDSTWNKPALYLGVTINGVNEFSPRERITSVPYAFQAGSVTGKVNAEDGTPVIDGSGEWVGPDVSNLDETTLSDYLTTNSYLTGSSSDFMPSDYVPDWTDIENIPSDFADDVDNDTTYSAGDGLLLADDTFSVDFGGPGSATTVARSDVLDELESRVSTLESSSSSSSSHQGAIFRWMAFSTYFNNSGWHMGNDTALHGGVNPSNWTDGNHRAVHMSSNSEILRTLLTRKAYGGANAMIHSEVYHQYSSTNGRVIVALVRINNTTESAIAWQPHFYYTCYNSWAERSGVALNGTEIWESGGTNCGHQNSANPTMNIPANGISTIIFSSASATNVSPGSNVYVRYVNLTFYNNSLTLPEGLEYVDDLDTVTGNLW